MLKPFSHTHLQWASLTCLIWLWYSLGESEADARGSVLIRGARQPLAQLGTSGEQTQWKEKKHCNMLCSPIPGWAAQTPGMLAFVCFFPWLQQNALEQGSNIIINQLWMCFWSFNTKAVITRGKCFPFEISYFWLIRHYSAFLARACVEDELRSVLQGKAAVNAASLVRHSTRKAQTQSKNATSREGKGL